MKLLRLALFGFFLCVSIPISPAQAANLYAGLASMDGATSANEDEWNAGLASLSDGNFAAAFEHWTAAGTPGQSGEKGHYLAQLGLSILYRNGLGVEMNEDEASRWMALGWEDRTSTALQEKVGNSSIGAIYTMLGRAYEGGTGVTRDLDRARFAYSMGAQYQNAESAFRIGMMMENGEGAASWDYGGALRYFAQAAKSGHAKAQYALATMYLEGRGAAQDYGRAYLWFSLAAANAQRADDFDAIGKRDELGARMTPDQLALSQELAQRCLSSEYLECDGHRE